MIASTFDAQRFIDERPFSLSPLAAAFYPRPGRATGVNWMLGIGRFGAILGAFMFGVLL